MSKQAKFPKTNILGLEVDQLTANEAIAAIVDMGKNSKASGYIVRPHVEFIEQASKQPDILKLLNEAEFSLVDGVALQWAASHLQSGGKSIAHLVASLTHIPFNTTRLRRGIRERVAGISFTIGLLKQCQAKGASIYIIGSPQKRSINDTVNHIHSQFPKLKITGSYAARRDGKRVFLSGQDEKNLYRDLLQLKPDIILVGLGFPRQERLMASLSCKLDHGIFVGEGGTFDYKEFGGHIKRAPKIFRQAGLEWVWRLGRQPKRLRRQLAIPRFIHKVHRHKKQQ
jgi:N-acetylglucosaminyldiphosphoundecaprenol N-acetyl-beta-D-mannosaminyltransferase